MELALPRKYQPGTPRSLANAHSCLDAAAAVPIAAMKAINTTIEAIAVVPAVEFVAWAKISMNGNPVVLENARSRSPAQ